MEGLEDRLKKDDGGRKNHILPSGNDVLSAQKGIRPLYECVPKPGGSIISREICSPHISDLTKNFRGLSSASPRVEEMTYFDTKGPSRGFLVGGFSVGETNLRLLPDLDQVLENKEDGKDDNANTAAPGSLHQSGDTREDTANNNQTKVTTVFTGALTHVKDKNKASPDRGTLDVDLDLLTEPGIGYTPNFQPGFESSQDEDSKDSGYGKEQRSSSPCSNLSFPTEVRTIMASPNGLARQTTNTFDSWPSAEECFAIVERLEEKVLEKVQEKTASPTPRTVNGMLVSEEDDGIVADIVSEKMKTENQSEEAASSIQDSVQERGSTPAAPGNVSHNVEVSSTSISSLLDHPMSVTMEAEKVEKKRVRHKQTPTRFLSEPTGVWQRTSGIPDPVEERVVENILEVGDTPRVPAGGPLFKRPGVPAVVGSLEAKRKRLSPEVAMVFNVKEFLPDNEKLSPELTERNPQSSPADDGFQIFSSTPTGLLANNVHQSGGSTPGDGSFTTRPNRLRTTLSQDGKDAPAPADGAASAENKAKRFMHRCKSMVEVETFAKKRWEEASTLTGDGLRKCRLPVISGKNPDLNTITVDTMAALARGDYKETVPSYTVVDCRYPYEYKGGHIKGAVNLYTRDAIMEDLLKGEKVKAGHVLIFHCEFSSERGPKMCRFLRNQDRSQHEAFYPALSYPEMYILELGYKKFFEKYQELCEPQTYVPMLHADHTSELRDCKVKAKTWGGMDQQLNRGQRKRLFK